MWHVHGGQEHLSEMADCRMWQEEDSIIKLYTYVGVEERAFRV